jgi:FlaA1/EpsC-like NDP-sugar epimerase
MIQTKIAYWFVGLSRKKKAVILISMDAFFVLLAFWLSLSLRWGVWYVPTGDKWYLFAVAPFIAIPIFARLGLYRAIIRYIEIRALWVIVQATALYALAFAFVIYESDIKVIPRTVSPLNWVLIMLFIGSSRFCARCWLGEIYFRLGGSRINKAVGKKNVVIYGAGSAGAQLAAALEQGREFKAVAFIDDDALIQDMKINNLKIHSLASLKLLIDRYQVSHVLLAMPSVSRARIGELIRMLEPYKIHVMSMPGLSDIAQGRVTVDALQEVDIADLLGRDAVSPNPNLLSANISGKVVMVTGAGGSIGSELCRQIIQLQPTALVLYEMCEFGLYAIENELNFTLKQVNQSLIQPIELITLLGSVTDAVRVEKVCKTFKVQTIYHAAAYKHVPMVEKNPGQGIWNNIFGTLHTAQAAINAGVELFVLISTDKAVRPTNTMGATKRFAELILQALSLQNTLPSSTRFTMVRFGNVLGSSGSVVPLFREQIARGGPVTVTDARIIRYFMTIPEAAQLVIQAGALAEGGDVFVLDMGEPIRILDLAKRMIHLSGLQMKDESHPAGEIEISFTGLRPGEKLYEELLIGDNVTDTHHPRIMRAEEHVIPWNVLDMLLSDLKTAAREDDFIQVRDILKQAVTGFVPQCGIDDLVWKQDQR